MAAADATGDPGPERSLHETVRRAGPAGKGLGLVLLPLGALLAITYWAVTVALTGQGESTTITARLAS